MNSVQNTPIRPAGPSLNGWRNLQPLCPNLRHRSRGVAVAHAAPPCPRERGTDHVAQERTHSHGEPETGALDVLHLWLDEQRTPAERQADRLGIHLTRTTSNEA